MTAYSGLIGLSHSGQSPIDISEEIVRSKQFPPLIINGHWLKDGEAYLVNNGADATILLTGDRIPSTVTGGPFGNDEYEFYNAHFHWGQDNCRGSEHTLNGTWFSMEAHIVHWNRKYLTFEECLKHKDGICIFAYFLLTHCPSTDLSNPLMEKITDYLKYIVEPGSEVKIPSNALCWMRVATLCPYYYVYQGSYNIDRKKKDNPECATWIIFPSVITLSADQVEAFRQLKDREGNFVLENYREIQALQSRRVFVTY